MDLNPNNHTNSSKTNSKHTQHKHTPNPNPNNKETNNHDTNIPDSYMCNGTTGTFHNLNHDDINHDDINHDDLTDIHNSLKRIFTSKDGERVLKYWQSSIIERPLASDTNVKQMYYTAGERNFILKLKRILTNDK